MKIPHDPDEIIAVVDDEDNIIDKQRREIAHDKKLLHREAALLIVNLAGDILVQQRADNHMFDTSVAGHFPYDDNYEDAIIREAKEELQLSISKDEITYLEKIRISSGFNGSNNRFVKFFELRKDILLSSLTFDRDEILKINYMKRSELIDLMNQHPEALTAGFTSILKSYFRFQK